MGRSALRVLFVTVTAALTTVARVPACTAQEPVVADAHHEAAHAHLGRITLPNSGAPAAQASFLNGVALLHSFMYDDAATAFAAAEHADAGFALAYWMDALTHRHLLWSEEDLPAARAVLARLGPAPAARLARAATARERSYGAAVEALFEDAPEPVRARAFADSLQSLSRGYPADLEAAAFASVARLASLRFLPANEVVAGRATAAALAQRVWDAAPDHPGAAHYLVHAYDVPGSGAEGGLRAAAMYARIAPGAEHALHMPSHIFARYGRWDDVVVSNVAAMAATRARAARLKLQPGQIDYHAAAWLYYGMIEQGRLREAAQIGDTLLALGRIRPPVPDSLHDEGVLIPVYYPMWYATALRNDPGVWRAFPAPPGWLTPSRALAITPRPLAGFDVYAIALLGMQAAATGDTTIAMAAVARLRVWAGAQVTERPRFALEMLADETEAVAATNAGDDARAITLLTEAAALEDRTGGPANAIAYSLPAGEMLGGALATAGKFTQAASAYTRALRLAPNRTASLLGLARAQLASGDTIAARATYTQLANTWHLADDVPEVREARRWALQPTK